MFSWGERGGDHDPDRVIHSPTWSRLNHARERGGERMRCGRRDMATKDWEEGAENA